MVLSDVDTAVLVVDGEAAVVVTRVGVRTGVPGSETVVSDIVTMELLVGVTIADVLVIVVGDTLEITRLVVDSG